MWSRCFWKCGYPQKILIKLERTSVLPMNRDSLAQFPSQRIMFEELFRTPISLSKFFGWNHFLKISSVLNLTFLVLLVLRDSARLVLPSSFVNPTGERHHHHAKEECRRHTIPISFCLYLTAWIAHLIAVSTRLSHPKEHHADASQFGSLSPTKKRMRNSMCKLHLDEWIELKGETEKTWDIFRIIENYFW